MTQPADLWNSDAKLLAGATLHLVAEGRLLRVRIARVIRVLPEKRIVVQGVLTGSHQAQEAQEPQEAPQVPETEQVVLLKLFLGGSARRKCQREIDGVRRLQSAGIQTPDLLWRAVPAKGQTCLESQPREPKAGATSVVNTQGLMLHVLAFRWLHDARDLGYCQDGAKGHWHDFLQLIPVLAKLHAEGLIHADPHPCNFLHQPRHRDPCNSPGEKPQTVQSIHVVDGDAVRTYRGIRPALRNLALLLAQVPGVDREKLQQAIEIYRAERRWPPDERLLERLQRSQHRAWSVRLKRALKKTLRQSSSFEVQRDFSSFVSVRRSEMTPGVQALLEEFNEHFSHRVPSALLNSGDSQEFQVQHKFKGVEVVQQGNTATVMRIACEDEWLVVKRYNIKSLRHGLGRLLRPSRALRSWQNAERLRVHGISTVAHKVLLEKRFGPLRRGAVLVMADGGSETLRQRVDTQRSLSRDILCQLVHLFEKLALAGIVHGDCKANNFLLLKNTVLLVDLDAMSQPRSASGRRRGIARDLRRFMRNWQKYPELEQMFARAFEASPVLAEYADSWKQNIELTEPEAASLL